MKKILIINSNYYKKISDNLVFKAKDKLLKTKFKVKILEVPGVHEIPIAIRKNIKNERKKIKNKDQVLSILEKSIDKLSS